MREGWVHRQAVAAVPVGFGPFGRRRAPFSLVIDLAEDVGSRRWWRGAATLALLAATLGWLAPGLDPLPGQRGAVPPRAVADQWRAGRIAPLAEGGTSGMRMAPGQRVEPIAFAPERTRVDLTLRFPPDGLRAALVRAGASDGDSARVAALVAAAGGKPDVGTAVTVVLGRSDGARRSVERVALRGGLDFNLVIERWDGVLQAQRIAIAVDSRPVRMRGVAGNGLYWALRNAGASTTTAADYLKALAESIDVGEIGRDDRFDLVVANRRSADGQGHAGMLLYAAIDRTFGDDVKLVRWTAGGKPIWVNLATLGTQRRDDNAMQWPVSAPITSRFGLRVHPILRFARMHRGIDFGARWGTPIHAAADGQVTRAGWAGGYGRQVRLAHGGGLATSYSHMSSMAVAPGTMVHRGDVIGYVGTSGLSTGAHLHYEVYRGGVAVDPLSVRFATSRPIDPKVVAAIKARAKELAP